VGESLTVRWRIGVMMSSLVNLRETSAATSVSDID
jgi:hypothetical protein